MSHNPFPGPQPYRAAERHLFFGRDALVKKLSHQLLARTVTTLYGPSGAGKSSLMQAGVIPRLQETHDFRVVGVDGWPPGEGPLSWLTRVLFAELELSQWPGDLGSVAALEGALRLAERQSEQPILIYLDQIEQILSPERAPAEALALIEGVDRMARSNVAGLQIVLSLREDYLGRFRDRARDHRELLAHGFRLGPLTVAEMVRSVCRAATEGSPPQSWSEEQLQGLMREVRVPGQSASDEAEVQAAYAQIVCRALFQERAQGKPDGEIEAEAILRRYLDSTLEALGPLAPAARPLLEDHLVTADGSRTLRTEKELLRLLPAEKLTPILAALEGAAILRAEAHHGSRYFEIGHDWLARKVYEERQQRERAEEQRRHADEQAARLASERADADARLRRARAQRRLFAVVALVSTATAAGAGVMGTWAWRQRSAAVEARQKADLAQKQAEQKAVEASDARLMAGFRELKNRGQLGWATRLLSAVQEPEAARGWLALASDALGSNALFYTLRGHEKAVRAAVWSHDGRRALTASADASARLWSADGSGDPLVFTGHEGPLTAVAFSPDDARVLTASEDGTARVFRADGTGQPVVLDGHGGPVRWAAWSPDGKRVVTASADMVARVWNAEGAERITLAGHRGPLTAAVFFPDGERILTASEDGTAMVFRADGQGPPVVLKGHESEVLFAAPSPDGKRVVTTSTDRTARVWDASGRGTPLVLAGHERSVVHAAWSPDGARVVTASVDQTARVWSADRAGDPVILSGHTRAVTFVDFRPDGRYVVTASRDQTARIWPVEGGSPFVLAGHEAPVRSAVFGPDGTQILTAAGEEAGGSPDPTARIWRPARLESLPRERQGFFHSASIGAGGDRVVSAYDDRSARLWRVDGAGAPVVFRGHDSWVASAALSPDGTRVVTVSFDRTARIVRVDGHGEPVVLAGARGAVRAAAWSPDGARVVTASDDGVARVHAADGKGEVVSLAGHADALTAAAWSPDGKRIVTASLDQTARVWRADGAGAPLVLSGHAGGVLSAAWSPDGARILTASADGTARVWDSERGAAAARLDHDSPVLSAIWSPDGQRIATAPQRGGLRLWRAGGGGDPIELETAAPLLAMAFLAGGREILTVASDDTTRSFTIDLGALERGLELTNADCLPWGMRAIYLGEPRDKAQERTLACERAHGRASTRAPGRVP